ncbi:hypothetical protein [Formosa maritima]|uniref:hypothetical protein n=1 Tax=Formosa maritima TaxID=2592046 RepID=UPI001F162FE8|nr:hypothetical protein [Formosa maritima]
MFGVFSCQKEDDVHIESYNEDLSIKEYTFEELNNNNEFNTSFSKVIDGLKKNGFVHGRSDGNNNFEIDSTVIKEIQKGNTTSYTFFAILENQEPNSFNNVVIQVDSINSTKALLITYFPEAPMEYIEGHDSFSFQGTYTTEEIDFNLTSTQNRDMDNCTTVYYCTWGGTVHYAGENCTAGYIYSITSCSSGSGGGGSGGSGSGSPNDPDPVYTAPVIIPYKQHVIECLQLNQVENTNLTISNWIYNSDNFFQVRKMSTFLSNKNCSEKAQAFVIASIEAIINGDIDEFNEDFYTWGVTKDDTFVDSELDCIYEKLKGGNLGNNFFKDMLFEFDQLTPLKFSIGPTPNSDYAFTKGETTTIFGQTHASYEIISSANAESASNLDKMVTLSHELMHAFMFKSLEDWGIISFDNIGRPYLIETYDDMCQDDNLDEEININLLSMKDRWVFLICEILENSDDPNNNQEWTHSLFNSPVFAIETYREKLEQLLLNNHDWDGMPTSTKSTMILLFGDFNWKQKVAEYMSWSGLEDTPEFDTWLETQGSFIPVGSTYTSNRDFFDNGVIGYWIQNYNVQVNCN